MRSLIAVLLLASGLAAAGPHRRAHKPTRYRVEATAFCLHGETAAGTRSRVGTIAADPAFLAIGTRIRILEAGEHSGVYTVTDTGAKVQGRRIDLRLATPAEAKRFGRKRLRIQVLHWGDGSVDEVTEARPRH